MQLVQPIFLVVQHLNKSDMMKHCIMFVDGTSVMAWKISFVVGPGVIRP